MAKAKKTQQPELEIVKTKSVKGRKDNDGTEAVIKLKPLRDQLSDLLTLKAAADDATGELNDAVKVVAERTGLLSSVIKKLVKAKAGNDFAEAHRKVEQAALVFEEFAGEKPEPVAAVAGNGQTEVADPLAGSDLAEHPPEGMTKATLERLEEAGADADRIAASRAAAQDGVIMTH